MRVVVRAQDAVGFNVALYEGSEMQNRGRKLDDSTRLELALLEAKPLSGAQRLEEGRLGSGDKPRGSDRGDRFALLLQLRCGLLEGSTGSLFLRKHDQDPALEVSHWRSPGTHCLKGSRFPGTKATLSSFTLRRLMALGGWLKQ